MVGNFVSLHFTVLYHDLMRLVLRSARRIISSVSLTSEYLWIPL